MKPALTPTHPLALDVETGDGITVTIRVYIHESGVYRAEIQYPDGPLIEELSRSYRTEREARHHARVATQLFQHGTTVREVIDLVTLFDTQTPPPGRAANGDRGPVGTPPCEDAA